VACNHFPEGYTPIRPSEQENDIWEAMMAKYGIYEMGRRVAMREPYRQYISHWPYDHTENLISLDLLSSNGYDAANDERILEDIMADENVDAFLAGLTPKQGHIVRKLLTGARPTDIFSEEGYKHTGGVRYHKWIVRKKWSIFKEAQELRSIADSQEQN
jgi:hypothetical protein